MSLSALIRSMSAAGAPAEAIALAVEAIESAEAKLTAQREAARDRKRTQRARERDSHGTVTGQSEDGHTSTPLPRPPSPQTPQPPTPTPPDITTRARGLRSVPEGWSPSVETMRVLAAEGHDSGSIERALTMMRDHEFRTARSKWDATFRNWVREDAKRQPRKAPHERPHHDAKFEARQANLATFERGADIAARFHGKP